MRKFSVRRKIELKNAFQGTAKTTFFSWDPQIDSIYYAARRPRIPARRRKRKAIAVRLGGREDEELGGPIWPHILQRRCLH